MAQTVAERARKYRTNQTPEKRAERQAKDVRRQKRYRSKINDRSKALYRYGLSYDDYQIILEEQGNVCAACGNLESVRRRNGTLFSLAVDHNHTTKAIRGLLCQACNQSLGLLRESPDSILGLYRYLLNNRVSNPTEVLGYDPI